MLTRQGVEELFEMRLLLEPRRRPERAAEAMADHLTRSLVRQLTRFEGE